jgi:hypothetical protein
MGGGFSGESGTFKYGGEILQAVNKFIPQCYVVPRELTPSLSLALRGATLWIFGKARVAP